MWHREQDPQKEGGKLLGHRLSVSEVPCLMLAQMAADECSIPHKLVFRCFVVAWLPGGGGGLCMRTPQPPILFFDG